MPDLGKYAVEVLSAYALTLLLLAGLVVISWVRSRRMKRALEAAEARRTSG